MDDARDPLFGSGLRREPVVCALCGTTWDQRVVDEHAVGARGVDAQELDEPALSLCPSCLLTTSHGEPFPEDGEARAVEQQAVET